jgi:hypothetical protein
MAVRLSASTASCSLPAGRLVVLISVRGWVDPRAIVWLEGSGQLKNPMTSWGIEPATLWLVACCVDGHSSTVNDTQQDANSKYLSICQPSIWCISEVGEPVRRTLIPLMSSRGFYSLAWTPNQGRGTWFSSQLQTFTFVTHESLQCKTILNWNSRRVA